jgi:hypothetical protein
MNFMDNDRQNTNINFNLDGDRALSYLRERRRVNSRTLNIILFVAVMLMVGLFVMVFIHEAFTPVTPDGEGLTAQLVRYGTFLAGLSWSQVAKISIGVLTPFIAVAWLFHGVQARLLA